MSYHPGNGPGGKGAVVVYELMVSPGATFPVVVGNGGAGGSYANVSGWKDYMNGHAGGASSFGTVSAAGGGGGTQNKVGTDGTHSNVITATASHFQIGNSGVGGASSTREGQQGYAGTPGFVIVIYE